MRPLRSSCVSWLLTAWVTLLALGAVACADDQRDELTQAEREQVSQAYADTIRAIANAIDSTCRVERPALVARLADSLVEVRLADIERQQGIRSR